VRAAAGLEELIAPDQRSSENLAVRLAHDMSVLSARRSGLRARVASSSLADGPRFARAFSEAMRSIWSARCGGHR
jgi:predicted O-linked N-acetylglucosamine transferase (SPINDLY family)